MARNEEKHAGRLNRLWLQQLDEERLKKNPLRPGLGSLRTADEVKKWIPSIKNDIDFYLKQSQVGCYPDRKISEFTSKIEGLTKEYKAYLRKYRELEGNNTEVPWTDKPYARKHKLNQNPSKDLKERNEKVEEIATKKFVPLSVPILGDEDSFKDLYGYDTMNNAAVALNSTENLDSSINLETETLRPFRQIGETDSCINDKPLEFNRMKIDGYRFLKGKTDGEISSNSCNDELELHCKCVQTLTSETPTAICKYCGNVPKDLLKDNNQTHITDEGCVITKIVHLGNRGNQNILGLPYSDSSGDEEEG